MATQNVPAITEEANEEYPKPTTDGFEYRNAVDEQKRFETKKYENGTKVLRLYLTDGTPVVLRKAKAKDILKIRKIAPTLSIPDTDDEGVAIYLTIHILATFAGQQKQIEDMADLDGEDFTRIVDAFGHENF